MGPANRHEQLRHLAVRFSGLWLSYSKNTMRGVGSIGILFLSAVLFAQTAPPMLTPTLQGFADLGAARRAAFALRDSLLHHYADLNSSETQQLDSLMLAGYDETMEGPCDIIGMGCSWYCGGGPDSVWASSSLPEMRDRIFSPLNAHDLNYCTAWSEGVEGNGIGERLTYRFAPESPRLHTIIVVNGMVTDSASWSENNRVRELLVLENACPKALLLLDDTMSEQAFKVGLMGRRSNGEPMEITFEIRSVYRGSLHDHTILTEIYFDGTDVH
jgi:hypothetical protein